MIHFKKVAIVGVGLIGGSIGKAMRVLRLADEVVGIFRNRKPDNRNQTLRQSGSAKRSEAKPVTNNQSSRIRQAIGLGAIDTGTLSLRDGMKGAELVIIATPVGRIVPIVKRIAGYVEKGCIITDVGSTKEDIVTRIESFLPEEIYFAGGHPMAGSEKKGVEFCNDRLFKNAVCFLIKTGKTSSLALGKVLKLWEALGSNVIIMSSVMHDRAVARISHLPHIVACSLLNIMNEKELSLCSGGFKDITRIASSDPFIWRDICLQNRNNIIETIDRLQGRISKLKQLIKAGDERGLLREFKQAKEKREKI